MWPCVSLVISKLKSAEMNIYLFSDTKTGNWPISKSELVNNNLKQLICYINSIEVEKLNHSKRCK
jgi:hypothetical protein